MLLLLLLLLLLRCLLLLLLWVHVRLAHRRRVELLLKLVVQRGLNGVPPALLKPPRPYLLLVDAKLLLKKSVIRPNIGLVLETRDVLLPHRRRVVR